MIFTPTHLQGSFLIDAEPFVDERGWFARFYCKEEFAAIGHTKEWVQLNHSASNKKGTLRGLHFQVPPYREIKMVKCVRGAVYDVIVDVRKDSQTFLHWFGAELSELNRKMIYIPEGFAHGFQCLTNDCQLIYHHTEYYKPNAEDGLRFNDPRIGINWPLEVTEISNRDKSHTLLNHNFKGI
jgi:dTDP-4-dehydrorhamnose 3,5-epimerase